MEITTVVGLLIGIGGILGGNALEGGHINALIQGAAFVIVFGGTLGATILGSQAKDLKMARELFKSAFKKLDSNVDKQVYSQILEFARIARKDSILALEEKANQIKDPFFKEVVRAAIDGIDPKIIRETFETKIDVEESVQLSGAKVWTEAGGYAPTIGIIGAVLGLIHVMSNLSDTQRLASGIAVAFVATVYGIGIANLILLPLGNKIKKRIALQRRSKEMILEGVISIQSGLVPSLVQTKLQGYLDYQ